MHDGSKGYPREKYCVGAFISGSWFLTSASCLEPLPKPHHVTIMTGWGNLACSQRERWAFESGGLQIKLHPGYRKRSFVDLAMVRTRKTVFHVPEAQLNLSPSLKQVSQCRLVSFEEKHPQREESFLTVGFVSVKPVKCLPEDQEGRICTEFGQASDGEIRICPGKLGALLECDGKLKGLLTQPQITPRVCDFAGHLQIFEDIYKHQNWILNTIEETYDFIYNEVPPKGWKDIDDETFADLLKEYELWTESQRIDFKYYKMTRDSIYDQDIRDLYIEINIGFIQNLDLLISTIVLCAIFSIAVIYFCYIQLHRFDNHLTI